MTADLICNELIVDPSYFHQAVMCSRLLHNTILNTNNNVSILDGGQSISNCDSGASFSGLLKR